MDAKHLLSSLCEACRVTRLRKQGRTKVGSSETERKAPTCIPPSTLNFQLADEAGFHVNLVLDDIVGTSWESREVKSFGHVERVARLGLFIYSLYSLLSELLFDSFVAALTQILNHPPRQ
mmetsp:Transcript_14841/g.60302  ORF Transcript_14841/g.60302 Transcript_14841/m.60302 type:complete len:120 (+) Transcript_14841:3992-4351(+)